MALLPPDMVLLHVKGNMNLKYHNIFLKGLLLSHLKHFLKVRGML